MIRNISQVTFFTYCHGAIETAKIIQNLYYNLKYKGVSEEDIMALFSHTRQVSFAPNTPADYIPSVRVESLQDVESKYFNGGFDVLDKLNSYEKMNSKPMIPKLINITKTPINELKMLIRNSGEIKWSRWNPSKNIVNYVSIDWLINSVKQDFRAKYKIPIDPELQKYQNLDKIRNEELKNEIKKYFKFNYLFLFANICL